MAEYYNSPLEVDQYHFEKHLDELSWKPIVGWDENCEICYEWISKDRNKHAVVSLEGDGRYGYTYLVGDKFVAGKKNDPLVTEFPQDLREYLKKDN